MIVVAVDAGGTSTRCVVAEDGGRCVGYARAGSGNPVSAGVELAAASFADGIAAALGQAGVAGAAVDGVVFSMAGGLTSREWGAFRDRLRALGIGCDPVLEPDLLGNYCSATSALSGYALVSGTGAGAVRVEGGAVAKVADGLGWLLGDYGSGFWIGRRVVRAAFADLDGRGPATTLTTATLAELGLRADPAVGEAGRPDVAEAALRLVYALRPVELSRFAHLAFRAADDEVARDIVARAAAQLADTLRCVAAPGVRGPVALAGGVLSRNPAFASAVARLCAGELPSSAFWTVRDGAVGAVVLALRRLGVTVDDAVFATIVSTLTTLSDGDVRPAPVSLREERQ